MCTSEFFKLLTLPVVPGGNSLAALQAVLVITAWNEATGDTLPPSWEGIRPGVTGLVVQR